MRCQSIDLSVHSTGGRSEGPLPESFLPLRLRFVHLESKAGAVQADRFPASQEQQAGQALRQMANRKTGVRCAAVDQQGGGEQQGFSLPKNLALAQLRARRRKIFRAQHEQLPPCLLRHQFCDVFLALIIVAVKMDDRDFSAIAFQPAKNPVV